MKKTLVEPEKTQQSLINLKEELIRGGATHCPEMREVLFKINSCLFSEYPQKPTARPS